MHVDIPSADAKNQVELLQQERELIAEIDELKYKEALLKYRIATRKLYLLTSDPVERWLLAWRFTHDTSEELLRD